LEAEVEAQKEELKKAREKVLEEERGSRTVHEELAQIRKTKNKIKECLTYMKNKQPLPTKKEAGRRFIVMNSDLDALQAEIVELDAMKDRILTLSDHDKSRYDQMLKESRSENRSLKKELDHRDRVFLILYRN
jgi:hypothetical protein